MLVKLLEWTNKKIIPIGDREWWHCQDMFTRSSRLQWQCLEEMVGQIRRLSTEERLHCECRVVKYFQVWTRQDDFQEIAWGIGALILNHWLIYARYSAR